MASLEYLNSLEVVDVVADTKNGFFFIEFNNGRSLQCCLVEQGPDIPDKQEIKYFPAIDSRDCGFDWGICGEANEWAAREDNEWGHILDYLLATAESHGVHIRQ